MNDFLDLMVATLRLGGPLVLAGMAGVLSERSGIIDIGLEGKMLGAAAAAALMTLATGSAWIGLLTGLVASTLLALLHAMSTLLFRIDHVVSGMAVNALSLGVTGFAAKVLSSRGAEAQFEPLPQTLFLALAIVIPFLVHFYFAVTASGLRVTAVGNDPHKAAEVGLSPTSIRARAQIGVGVLSGLAGVMLVSQPAQFSAGMTAGKGFIALAAVILGGWRPMPTFLAALGFGLFDALQLRLQGKPFLGVQVPTELWASLPYLLTLIALAGFLGRSKPPAALGKS